jgi:ribosomal protein S18 acetylase RimI-like enzyme
LAEDAWPAGSAIGSKEQELSGMEGYMEFSLSLSNWTDIACTSEGIVGFLFGRIDNYLGKGKPKKSLLGEIPSITKSFFEYGRMTPGLLRFLWNLVLTEMKVKLRTPKSDASIEMFIVDSKHRGKGVGSDLINRFLSVAREAGSSLVTVYTDDRMSDWQFYERRGFRRVGTFYDNITSHYSGLDTRGIIFILDMRAGKSSAGSAQEPSD